MQKWLASIYVLFSHSTCLNSASRAGHGQADSSEWHPRNFENAWINAIFLTVLETVYYIYLYRFIIPPKHTHTHTHTHKHTPTRTRALRRASINFQQTLHANRGWEAIVCTLKTFPIPSLVSELEPRKATVNIGASWCPGFWLYHLVTDTYRIINTC